jgi:L-ribulose-5-phosphate 3-epimerase
MGTPEYSVLEAIDLFAAIGLDGAEIVVQDGYISGIPLDSSEEDLRAIKDYALKRNIEIVCLTPYFSDYNCVDAVKRAEAVDGLRKVMGFAEVLGARYIRIYGGTETLSDLENASVEERQEKERILVETLRMLGEESIQKGIVLVIENHFNTMAVSAADTAHIIEKVDHPGVGALYDQANLAFTAKEEYAEAIALQKGQIKYVHVKDLVFKSEDWEFKSSDVTHQKEEERSVSTRIVGEGILPWPKILTLLNRSGYEGWLSLEYERRWHPQDIPDARIGMKKSAEYVRKCLKDLRDSGLVG